jgi:ABC-type dipeptide/oligopeptide/nickel transport system ATPase component
MIISHCVPPVCPCQGLKGVSFTVPPGTTTALVGRTGSGKSTIGRLLFRFYDPLHGAVYLNGSESRGVQQRSLRRLIGVVSTYGPPGGAVIEPCSQGLSRLHRDDAGPCRLSEKRGRRALCPGQSLTVA